MLARTRWGPLPISPRTRAGDIPQRVTNLPITDDPFQTNYRGSGDAYVTRFKPTKLPTGDVCDDDTVNFLDVLQIAEMWLASGQFHTDLTGDEHTNLHDYTILANHWRHHYTPPRSGR